MKYHIKKKSKYQELSENADRIARIRYEIRDQEIFDALTFDRKTTFTLPIKNKKLLK